MFAKTRYGYGGGDLLVFERKDRRDQETGHQALAVGIDVIWRASQKRSGVAILTVAEAYQLIDQIKATLAAMGEKDPRKKARKRKSKKVLAAETAYREGAKAIHHQEGELEIDDNAEVSMGDPAEGAYVQAWAWVSSEDL